MTVLATPIYQVAINNFIAASIAQNKNEPAVQTIRVSILQSRGLQNSEGKTVEIDMLL